MSGPELKGRYPVTLGDSFRTSDTTTRASCSGYTGIRYNFQPGTMDKTRDATLEKGNANNISSGSGQLEKDAAEMYTLTVPNTLEDAPDHIFRGHTQPVKDIDCILIYDDVSGTYRLERLERLVKLDHVRSTSTSNTSHHQHRASGGGVASATTSAAATPRAGHGHKKTLSMASNTSVVSSGTLYDSKIASNSGAGTLAVEAGADQGTAPSRMSVTPRQHSRRRINEDDDDDEDDEMADAGSKDARARNRRDNEDEEEEEEEEDEGELDDLANMLEQTLDDQTSQGRASKETTSTAMTTPQTVRRTTQDATTTSLAAAHADESSEDET